MMKARGLWKAVCDGTEDEEEDRVAMEAILKSTPSEYVVALGSKDSAKEAWDSLKTMRLGNERARKAKAQQLRREYEALEFRDGLLFRSFPAQSPLEAESILSALRSEEDRAPN